jgi:hypothetical protein
MIVSPKNRRVIGVGGYETRWLHLLVFITTASQAAANARVAFFTRTADRLMFPRNKETRQWQS